MEDINSCTARKLVKLAGLSQALASRIVAYRKQAVSVQCLDELLKINGVTRVIFKTITSNFCVKQQTTRSQRVNRNKATNRKKKKQNQMTKEVNLRSTAASEVSQPHDIYPVNNIPVITRIPDPNQTENQTMSAPGQLTMYSPVKLTASPSGSKLTTVYRRLPTMSVCQKTASPSKGKGRVSGKVSCVSRGRESERPGDNVDISTQTIPPASSLSRRKEDFTTVPSQTAEDKRVSIEKWLQMVETPQSSPQKTFTLHSLREADGRSLGRKTSMTNLTKHTPKPQAPSTSAAVEPLLFRTDVRQDIPTDSHQGTSRSKGNSGMHHATHRSQRNIGTNRATSRIQGNTDKHQITPRSQKNSNKLQATPRSQGKHRSDEVDGPSRTSSPGRDKRHRERSSRKPRHHRGRRDKRKEELVPRGKEMKGGDDSRRHSHTRSRSRSRGAEKGEVVVAQRKERRRRDTHRRSRVRYRSSSRGTKQSTEWVAEKIERRGRGRRRHSSVRSSSRSRGATRRSRRGREEQKQDQRSSNSSPVRSVSSVERIKSANTQSRCSVM